MVLPATLRDSSATGERQVNVPLARNNDLPYGFWRPSILRRTPVLGPAVLPLDAVLQFLDHVAIALPRQPGGRDG